MPAPEVMQDAEKLQLAVEQMQQILNKAQQIVKDPNLPKLLAEYVTRDCILPSSQEGAYSISFSKTSRIFRSPCRRSLRCAVLL